MNKRNDFIADGIVFAFVRNTSTDLAIFLLTAHERIALTAIKLSPHEGQRRVVW